ncbi:MAG: protein-disulfide reductase DsbD [Acidiferrobacter sp.]
MNNACAHYTPTNSQKSWRFPSRAATRHTWIGCKTLLVFSLIACGLFWTPESHAATPGTGPIAAFKAFFSHRQKPFLKRGQAFHLDLTAPTKNKLIARFTIARGYYLYRDKIHFELVTPRPGVTLGPILMPPAVVEKNPYLGTLIIYKKSFALPLALTGTHAGEALTVVAHYQGCAVRGICYPPVTHTLHITLPNAQAIGAAAASPASASPASASPASASPASGKPGFIAIPAPRPHPTSTTWLVAIISAFGIGLLLTFTPCVLPMIPILSSMLVGQGRERLTKMEGAKLSAAYVLGTGVTYAGAGALAGATGQQLQAYFENAWGIGLLSFLFMLMALSLFDLYTIQMPSFVQSRIETQSRRVNGRSLTGAFVLGLLSALVVGACVSPLLVSALAVAISSHSATLGAAIMFSMALGMGVVLVALGIGAGYLLPKVGPWMDAVKYTFGVLLLGVAIYLLGLLPAVPVLLLWAALLIVVGVYLGGGRIAQGATGFQKLRAGVGILLILWGALSLIGGLQGNRNPLHPLTFRSAGVMKSATHALVFHKITSLTALHRELVRARTLHEPALVDFSASWCVDCTRLRRETFPDRKVQRALRGFTLIEADVTQNTSATRALKRAFGVLGPPAVLFFSASGKPQVREDFYGYEGPRKLVQHARKVKSQ